MVAPVLGALLTTAGGVALAEFIRRPLKDLTDGLVLTEDLPVKTGLKMYTDGIFTREQFINTMNAGNIKSDQQQAYLTLADKIIEENKSELFNKNFANVGKEIVRVSDKLIDLTLDDTEKESKAIASEIERLQREGLDIELDEQTKLIGAELSSVERELRFEESRVNKLIASGEEDTKKDVTIPKKVIDAANSYIEGRISREAFIKVLAQSRLSDADKDAILIAVDQERQRALESTVGVQPSV